MQNPMSEPVEGDVYFWNGAGALLGSRSFSLGARGALVLPTATVSGVAGQSGSITIIYDGGYGNLAGKTVALETATGLSFDSPMAPRPAR